MKYSDLIIDKETIIGCDEVGTGSAVGCICVAGVRAPKDWILEGLNDSKKLSEKKRNIMRSKLLELIKIGEIDFYLAERSNKDVDSLSLGVALKQAYVEVFNKLYTDSCKIIVDGNLKFTDPSVINCDIVSFPKADGQVPAVMAASILAKTHRDQIIKEKHNEYPNYGWNDNVGYLTPQHIAAIKKYGLSDFHRKSYNFKFI